MDQALKQWLKGRKRGKDGNTKIWISWEWKELFRWNKKHFSYFLKGYHLVKNKNFIKNRHLQIACKVMTVLISCTQTALCLLKNLCMVLIPLSEDSLNLQCLFFCPVLGYVLHSSIMLSYLVPCCIALKFLFVCFHRSQICSSVINLTSLSQSKGLLPFILICRWKKYHWRCLLGLHINYTKRSREQCMYSLKNYLSVTNIG